MEKQVVLVVMDGVGKSKTGLGDAVGKANTPTLDKLLAECPHTYIKAHGTAVGLPSDEDMGNSEVGHNGQQRSRAQRARLRAGLLAGRETRRRGDRERRHIRVRRLARSCGQLP